VLGEVSSAAARWRDVAAELGLGDDEIGLMTPAFEHQAVVDAQAANVL
jgi:hypothetical protein